MEAKSGAGYTPYYYHADGLGSITGLSDATGTMVQTYGYDAFGNVTVSGSGNVSQPFMFTGREYDTETQMYFYRARYYDPQAGRFVTKDPIGFGGGDFNLFTYVKNNSIRYNDPEGLYTQIIQWAVVYGPPVILAISQLIKNPPKPLFKTAKCEDSKDDCDKEWEDAYELCRKELNKPNPSRGITGGYGNIHDCARGHVSQRCGGNPVEWYP